MYQVRPPLHSMLLGLPLLLQHRGGRRRRNFIFKHSSGEYPLHNPYAGVSNTYSLLSTLSTWSAIVYAIEQVELEQLVGVISRLVINVINGPQHSPLLGFLQRVGFAYNYDLASQPLIAQCLPPATTPVTWQFLLLLAIHLARAPP